MNLICSAFAFQEGYETSLQTGKKAGNETTEMYLKNIFVALSSAKRYNSNDTVMLITNSPLSKEWQERYKAQGIEVKVYPFESFQMPARFPWALAFYKVCALQAAVESKLGEYEKILLLDGDTYTTGSFQDLWEEASQGVLLYPVGHTTSHSDRQIIARDFHRLYPEYKETPTHYGGELIGGSRKHLEIFMEKCHEIYDKMKACDFQIEDHAGDETLWSIGAWLLGEKLKVIGAAPYLFRFWTGKFYLVSTVTVSNPVCIWHIPNEKETGFLRIYQQLSQKGTLPTVEKAGKIFGITKAKRPWNYYTFANKLSGKLKRWRTG